MVKSGELVARKYKVIQKIGEGKFGIVFSGFHTKTNEQVAIKLEDLRTPAKLLKNEAALMKYLYDHGSRNIPIVYWYGLVSNSMGLVMPLYECSLFDYLKKHEVPIEKGNLIMISAINILESIHKSFVLHRDIKPQNFMIKNGELYLIDFGLSTFYVNGQGEHFDDLGPINENIVGNPKYVSYNIHEGHLGSRRDDLISLGYMYLYIRYRELPWDNLKSYGEMDEILDESHVLHFKNKQRRDLKKLDAIESVYCEIGQNILKYLTYCYKLKYKDSPNYEGSKLLFSCLS